MVLLHTTVTIVCFLVILAQFYPAVVDSWLDMLIGYIEQWEEQRADTAQREIKKRIQQTEDRIWELREETAALQWFKVTLAMLPVEESIS